jgi:hypothetical protein
MLVNVDKLPQIVMVQPIKVLKHTRLLVCTKLLAFLFEDPENRLTPIKIKTAKVSIF